MWHSCRLQLDLELEALHIGLVRLAVLGRCRGSLVGSELRTWAFVRGPPAIGALSLFWGEGSPTKVDYRKKGILILTSLLEDLVLVPICEK